MGMVVRSNIMALNANRQLGMNNSQVSKSLEKLSSGFKINRAGDDASGLAISEKMKAQIKALDTASANCQDGISLVQTAEGALTEVHDMLNRMVELAGKSANGTMEQLTDSTGALVTPSVNNGGTDRNALQEEMNALCKEIDRIADSTNFNGIKLLNGNLSSAGAAGNSLTDADITQATTSTITATPGVAGTSNETVVFDVAGAAFAKDGTVSVTLGGKEYSVDVTADMTDEDFATALADAINADKITDATAGDFTAAVDTTTTTQITLTSANQGASGVTWETDLAIAPKAADGAAAASAVGRAGGDPATVAASYNYDLSGMTALTDTQSVTIAGVTITAKATGAGATDIDLSGGQNASLDDQLTAIADILNADTTVNSDWMATVQDGVLTLTAKDPDNLPANAPADASWNGTDVTADAVEDGAPDNTNGGNGNALTLQIGEDGQQWNKMDVSIDDMHVSSLFANAKPGVIVDNTKDPGNKTIDISSQDAASDALDSIREAVNTVSTQRAKLGAIQNRLEHTINNLDVASENMNSANSRVRDTDMAKQMMSYTQMNVLTQAAQAMLAQANQQPQSVLQLLQ